MMEKSPVRPNINEILEPISTTVNHHSADFLKSTENRNTGRPDGPNILQYVSMIIGDMKCFHKTKNGE